jgi:Arc/MetJ family transcription regulator
MRTTIELPAELMSDLMALSHARKKKDAVRDALEEYVRRKKLERLLTLPGSIEVSDVTAEMERMELGESAGAD